MKKQTFSQWLYLAFLLLCLFGSIMPMYAGYTLLTLDNYDHFFNILQNTNMSQVYFISIVLDNLNYTSIHVFSILYSMVTNLSLWNYAIIGSLLYLLAAKQESSIKGYIPNIYKIIGGYVCIYVIVLMILVFNFSITSGYAMMTLFQMIGWVMLIGHGVLLLKCIYDIIEYSKTNKNRC